MIAACAGIHITHRYRERCPETSLVMQFTFRYEALTCAQLQALVSMEEVITKWQTTSQNKISITECCKICKQKEYSNFKLSASVSLCIWHERSLAGNTLDSRNMRRSQAKISQNQRSFSVRFRQYQMRSPSAMRNISYLHKFCKWNANGIKLFLVMQQREFLLCNTTVTIPPIMERCTRFARTALVKTLHKHQSHDGPPHKKMYAHQHARMGIYTTHT